MYKTKEEIESWLNSHDIQHYKINSNLTVDVNWSVDISNKNLEEIPVKFRFINGDFECSYNKLTSLKNSPDKVNGIFYCDNNKLTSLEHAPIYADGDIVFHNNKLPITLYDMELDEIHDYYKKLKLSNSLIEKLPQSKTIKPEINKI